MNVYFACHWENKADQVKRLACLEQAIQDDATNIDVLIACYRLPQQKPEFHKKIVRLIHASADAVRQKIRQEPDDASNCNELAWLIANTEGDLDEALRLSQKSLETESQQRRPLRYPGPRLFCQGRLRKRD